MVIQLPAGEKRECKRVKPVFIPTKSKIVLFKKNIYIKKISINISIFLTTLIQMLE